MPKEPSSRQFRKGTKSCIECRQRKLRCIPAEDDSQPCQNCKERGRSCVLQTELGRNSESVAATSRDRIGQLEDEVSQLWSVVGELKTELGHAPSEQTRYHGTKVEHHGADTDSEASDLSPMNPPPHLQQLFDNEFLDSHGNDGLSSDISSDKASSIMVTRARTRLQALMPPKEDVRTIVSNAASWLLLYNALFPTMTMFANGQDMLAKYEALQAPDASPMPIASLLISISITVMQKPADLSNELIGIKDTAVFVRKVTETVEETIIFNDTLAGTLEGIETSLLYIRLQLIRVQTRKLWLRLRHIIALAELNGLPRAAQRVEIPDAMSPSVAEYLRTATRVESAAILWKSICTIDRFIGTMFNLPLGTSVYPFQLPKTIVSETGSVITQSFMAHLANTGCRIQEIDDAYIAQVPEVELHEKVFRADQELRSLGNMTPQEWWALPTNCSLADHLVQYWYNYFTVRTHLQLALRTSMDSQHTYSYLTCLQACRAMAVRYVNLRGLLPAAFFAGRVLDLQALTAAIFLLYNSKKPIPQQGLGIQDDGNQPATVLVQRMLETMDSITTQPSGDFGRQAAIAIRALRSLLEQPDRPDAQNLTLRVPMLGKINVNRHYQAISNTQPQQAYGMNAMQPSASNASFQPMQSGQSAIQGDAYAIPTMDSNELLSWSLDLMLDDIPPFPDTSFGGDQWLSWNGFNGPNGQPQS